MDKDEILKKSRNEYAGKDGEWEQSVASKAGKVGKTTGITLCVILVLLDDIFLHTRIVGLVAWIMFFAMVGTSDFVLYLNYKKKSKLVWAIVDILCAMIDLTTLIILGMRLTWTIN